MHQYKNRHVFQRESFQWGAKQTCLTKNRRVYHKKKEKCKLHLQSQRLKGLSDYQRQTAVQEASQKETMCANLTQIQN